MAGKAKTSRQAGTGAGSALVTGGASGIGLATVRLLAGAGWNVAALDRDEAAIEAARKTMAKTKTVRFATLDVTDEAAVDRAVAETVEAFGTVTGVVNCAGIGADKHVFDTSAELFRRMLDINVVGTFLVGRAAARVMRDNGGGSIVNIASISGLRGSKGRAAYGASKGAVVTLTQVMATDLARYGIRVNALAPGPVDTPMVQAVHTDADRALYRRYIPMRRYGTTEEMAKVIHFLLDGTQSGYITGEIIAADGGYRGAGLVADD